MVLETAEKGLDSPHAKALARQAVVHYLGSKPRRIGELAGGLNNYVFQVEHAREMLVVRMSSKAEAIDVYYKEQWATAKVRAIGIPAVEILAVGNEVIPFPYMITRHVPGTQAIHHKERFLTLREMGQYAARIHSITTTGFGAVFDWADKSLPRNTTWAQFLEHELRLDQRLETLLRQRMLTARRADKVRSSLESLVVRPTQTVLNHGDLRLKNVMVDEEGHITAILDWEQCVSNCAPHWDLSIALHDLSIDAKQEFLDGYGLGQEQIVEMGPVLRALNLVNYAPYVAQWAKSGDQAQLERCRTRLNGALDLYCL